MILATVLADSAHKTLRADEVHGRGHQEGLDTHVHETADRLRSAIGVKRRQNQVSSQRGLDRDFRGLKVSNLTDEDRVGILTKEGPQCSREIQANRFLHLHLIHATELELDWILGGHDVGVRFVQERDRGIKCVRFS